MTDTKYTDFVRTRITELRLKKDVSEHKMSLDLDKSGSYIRGITSGASMPSVKELFNIIAYFDMSLVDKATMQVLAPCCHFDIGNFYRLLEAKFHPISIFGTTSCVGRTII